MTSKARGATSVKLLLILLAFVQGGVLVQRLRGPESDLAIASVPPLGVGDRIETLWAVDSNGDSLNVSLASGAGTSTTVLVFSSTCVHCETVAPAWKAWLDGAPSTRVVLFAREVPESASAFVERHQLRAELAVAPAPEIGAPEWSLTVRTPTVVVFDSSGAIVFVGHGSRLSAVDSVLASQPAQQ